MRMVVWIDEIVFIKTKGQSKEEVFQPPPSRQTVRTDFQYTAFVWHCPISGDKSMNMLLPAMVIQQLFHQVQISPDSVFAYYFQRLAFLPFFPFDVIMLFTLTLPTQSPFAKLSFLLIPSPPASCDTGSVYHRLNYQLLWAHPISHSALVYLSR